MFCHEDAKLAREIARPPFEEYFRALNEAAGDWERGTSKDYRDYDTSMRRLRSFTLDGQIESGGAWVGTPDEIRATIRKVAGLDRQVRARLAADQFRHDRRPRGAEVDAAVRPRGDAGIRGRCGSQAGARRGEVAVLKGGQRRSPSTQFRAPNASAALDRSNGTDCHARLCPLDNLSPTLWLRYLRGEQR